MGIWFLNNMSASCIDQNVYQCKKKNPPIFTLSYSSQNTDKMKTCNCLYILVKFDFILSSCIYFTVSVFICLTVAVLSVPSCERTRGSRSMYFSVCVWRRANTPHSSFLLLVHLMILNPCCSSRTRNVVRATSKCTHTHIHQKPHRSAHSLTTGC